MPDRKLFLDIETTGRDDFEPIQIYFCYIDDKGAVSDLNIQAKPEKSILPFATTIHGVSQSEVETYPDAKTQAEAIIQWLGERSGNGLMYLIGHNVKFDINSVDFFLQKHLSTSINWKNVLCTLRLAQKMIPMDLVGNHKLDTVYYYLFPEKLNYLMKARTAHDAKVDIEITIDVFEKLYDLFRVANAPEEVSLETFKEYHNIADLLEEWPFGKMKGKKIKEEAGVARWFMNQKWAHEKIDIVHSVKHWFPSLQLKYPEG